MMSAGIGNKRRLQQNLRPKDQVISAESNFLHFSEYGADGSKVYRRPVKSTVGAHAPVEGIRFSEYKTQDNKASLRTTSKLILDDGLKRYGARKAPDLHPGDHNRPGWLSGKSPLEESGKTTLGALNGFKEFQTTDETPLETVDPWVMTERARRRDLLEKQKKTLETGKSSFGKGKGALGTADHWMFRESPNINLTTELHPPGESLDPNVVRPNVITAHRSDYLYDQRRRHPKTKANVDLHPPTDFEATTMRVKFMKKITNYVKRDLEKTDSPKKVMDGKFFQAGYGHVPIMRDILPKFREDDGIFSKAQTIF